MDFAFIFKALSESPRMRILFILQHGSFNVGELTELLGLSQSTVSHHLKLLDRAKLIDSKKEGTWVYYQLSNLSRTHKLLTLLLSNGSLAEDPALLAAIERDRESVSRVLENRRDKTLDFFESAASNWEKLLEDFPSYEVSLAALAAKIPSHSICLELGCGSGSLLKRILPRDGQTIAVDHSQAMLREAERALGKNGKVDLRLGRLEHLPVGDETIELAVSHMVFHHIPQPKAALEDVFRVLKPGGTFIVCDLVKHTREIMRERYADLWLGFEKEEFQNWLVAAGFCDIKIELIGDKQESFLISASRAR